MFPDLTKDSNVNTMLKKYARRADVILPDRKPWYNLRKSFCTDLMKTGTDILTYQKIARHSGKVALQHYSTDTEYGEYVETPGGLELGAWLKTYATPTKRTLGGPKCGPVGAEKGPKCGPVPHCREKHGRTEKRVKSRNLRTLSRN